MPNLITATRCLANLPPLAPRWLWKDRLPKGKIVLLAGPSGSGKTFIALDIAARITTNKGFPEPVPCNPSPVTPAVEASMPKSRCPQERPIGTPSCSLPVDRCSLQAPVPCNLPPVTSIYQTPVTCNPSPVTSIPTQSTAHLVDFSAEMAAATANKSPAEQHAQNCGSVLLITPEEDLIDNIRPRLEAAHADVNKVTATTDLRIDNLKSCTDQIEDLKLIIIDPLSFLVANDNESPHTATKLFDLYQHLFGRSISILALLPMHPGRADPLHRIPGINSLAPFASIIYAASPDHREENTQPNRRVLIQLKNSLSPIAPAMAFNIENSAVAWSNNALHDENIDAIITTPRRTPGPDPIKLDQCTQWLYEFLAPNPRPQAQVIQAANAAGFSYPTLRRAKAELKVQSRREKEGHWLWRIHPNQLEYDNFDQMTDEVLRLKFPPPM